MTMFKSYPKNFNKELIFHDALSKYPMKSYNFTNFSLCCCSGEILANKIDTNTEQTLHVTYKSNSSCTCPV